MTSAQAPAARILVVDDEAAIRALLKKIIERRGYEVDAAKDGAEAIDLLQVNSYDVMLIDLMMPNVNGFELVDYLAKHPMKKRPSVIVITAAAESKPLRQLDPSIVHSVVRKPFDIDVVADLVDAAAATSRAVADADDEESGDNVLSFPTC